MLPELREHEGEERRCCRGEAKADDDTTAWQCRGSSPFRKGESLAFARLGVADDVHVDPDTGFPDHLPDHRAAGQPLPAGSSARAHDELRCVQRPSRFREGRAGIVAHDLLVGAPELLDEAALLLEALDGRSRKPVLHADVHGEEVTLCALRDSGGTPDEPLSVRGARERHDNPLARFPGLLDPMASSVFGEALVHAVGEPEQRELA